MSEYLEGFRREALFASDLSLDMIAARFLGERNVLTRWAEQAAPAAQDYLREAAELRNELCIVVDDIRRSRREMRDAVEDLFSLTCEEP